MNYRIRDERFYLDSRQYPKYDIKRECDKKARLKTYFYYISDLNEIYRSENNYDKFEEEMFNIGNYFETPEEAANYMEQNNMVNWSELKYNTPLLDIQDNEYLFLYFEPLSASCYVTDVKTKKDKFVFCSRLKLK